MIDMVIDEQTTDEFARPVCHSAKDQHGLGIGNSNARRGGLDQFSEFVGDAGPVVWVIKMAGFMRLPTNGNDDEDRLDGI